MQGDKTFNYYLVYNWWTNPLMVLLRSKEEGAWCVSCVYVEC